MLRILSLRNALLILITMLAFSPFVIAADNDVLWYAQPAEEWVEALPIGNGRLGAMIYGGVHEETLSLNEDTLYTGEPTPCGVATIQEHVDEAFALIQAGR